MRKFFAYFLSALIFAGSAPSSFGQQKELSFEQIFRKSASNILQPLPVIQGWADDEHYLLMQKDKTDPDKLKLMSVDVKTGNAIPYTPVPATTPKSYNLNNKEKNPTPSPDGNWVAYTRDNNLF